MASNSYGSCNDQLFHYASMVAERSTSIIILAEISESQTPRTDRSASAPPPPTKQLKPKAKSKEVVQTIRRTKPPSTTKPKTRETATSNNPSQMKR